MPKEEWGVKRVCPKCATRFYDLQKDPMTCPSCEAIFDVASLVQQKSRTASAEKVEKKVEEADTTVADDADVLAAEADDADIDLDDDILDDDDDDTVNLEEIADMPADNDDS